MRGLKDVLTELQAVKELAYRPIEIMPLNTQPGMVAAQREALVKLEALRDEATEAASAVSKTVVAIGTEHVPEFVRLAKEEGVLVTVNAGQLVDELTDAIMPSFPPKAPYEWHATQHFLVVDRLTHLAKDLDVETVTGEFPPEVGVVLQDRAEVRKHIYRLVCNFAGQLLAVLARKQAMAIIEDLTQFPGSKLPILLYGLADRTELLALQLLQRAPWSPQPSLHIIEQKPTAEDVVRIFESDDRISEMKNKANKGKTKNRDEK